MTNYVVIEISTIDFLINGYDFTLSSKVQPNLRGAKSQEKILLFLRLFLSSKVQPNFLLTVKCCTLIILVKDADKKK